MTNAYRRTGSKERAWWNLTPKQKGVLQQYRIYGEYGGETAASVGRAPYFWSQELGSAEAGIIGTGNAQKAFEHFRARARDVVRAVARS